LKELPSDIIIGITGIQQLLILIPTPNFEKFDVDFDLLMLHSSSYSS
jgi:hypothetical protein